MTVPDATHEHNIPLLHISAGPHIRHGEDVGSLIGSLILSLIPACIAAFIIFGASAFFLIATTIVSSVCTESFIQWITKKKQSIRDFSAIATGLLLALTLPPHCPLWIAAAGAVFAIALVKMPFGGLGHSLVNPALAGRTFLLISFPAALTAYSAPLHGSIFGMAHPLDGVTAATPLVYFKNALCTGVFNPLDLQDTLHNLFWGNVGGSLGATSTIALFIGAMFLFYKGIIRFRISFSFIGTVFILFWIFNRTGGFFTTEAFIVPMYQIMSGGLMLGAFFMATDPVTSAITQNGKILFGIGCGILTFLFRTFGGFPDGVGFAILLMNISVPLIDRLSRPKRFGEVKKGE